MALTFKPISAVATANGSGNASTFGKATHVLVSNSASDATYTITRDNAADTTLGSFTIAHSCMVVVVKEMTDKLYASDAAVKFTAVAASGI